MQCNGKCQLMKKLKQADKEEQKQLPQTLKEKYEVLYCHTQTPFHFKMRNAFFEKHCLGKYKPDFYSTSFITDIFRPPKFSLI
jgi:hypothetical protein